MVVDISGTPDSDSDVTVLDINDSSDCCDVIISGGSLLPPRDFIAALLSHFDVIRLHKTQSECLLGKKLGEPERADR